jgi:hypothetical protein
MAGDVKEATDGNKIFPGVSVDGAPKDCSNGLGSSENCEPPLWRLEK